MEDIVFNCVHCEQELSVEATAAGTEIECPACGGKLVIPGPATPPSPAGPAPTPPPKVERHFAVPLHDKPADSLIAKPLPSLEASAKEAVKLRVKTIKRSDCQEVGKDHFDEHVTRFLEKVGDGNVVSISTFNYAHQDLETRAWVTDYGVMIVYRG